MNNDYTKIAGLFPSTCPCDVWLPLQNGFEGLLTSRGAYRLRRLVRLFQDDFSYEIFSVTCAKGVGHMCYAKVGIDDIDREMAVLWRISAAELLSLCDQSESVDLACQSGLPPRGTHRRVAGRYGGPLGPLNVSDEPCSGQDRVVTYRYDSAALKTWLQPYLASVGCTISG